MSWSTGSWKYHKHLMHWIYFSSTIVSQWGVLEDGVVIMGFPGAGAHGYCPAWCDGITRYNVAVGKDHSLKLKAWFLLNVCKSQHHKVGKSWVEPSSVEVLWVGDHLHLADRHPDCSRRGSSSGMYVLAIPDEVGLAENKMICWFIRGWRCYQCAPPGGMFLQTSWFLCHCWKLFFTAESVQI